MEPFSLFVAPAALGLLGFIEPCSLGATMLVLRHLDGRPAAARAGELLLFVTTRALVAGMLGVLAVLIGRSFTGFQQSVWIVLGLVYLLVGSAMATGRSGLLTGWLPSLPASALAARGGSLALGFLLGLGVPACAAPILFALFAFAAAKGALGAGLLYGFVALGVFGFMLSAPLLLFVAVPAARSLLEGLFVLGRRAPRLAGALLAALGLWSIAMGLFVDLEKWA